MDSRALVLALALVAACRGPHAEVIAASAEASPEPGQERVVVDLANTGGGHGEVDVEITLTGGSGRVVRASHTVELRAHETVQVVVDVPAPPERYTVEAEARYPD